MPTAMSTTLPLSANSLNSFSIAALLRPGREASHYHATFERQWCPRVCKKAANW
jgi:hypothetical protein